MKRLIACVTIALGLAAAGPALAHGAKAKHGGVVQSVNDLTFELVNKDGKAVIYVDDHGKAYPTTGTSGTLTILKGAVKTDTALEAAGSNLLATSTAVTLVPGAKAMASITLPGKQAMLVRFSKK